MSVEEVQQSTRQTAEGVKSCRSVLDLARAHDVDVPITEAVVRVCHEGEAPGRMVREIMSAGSQVGVSVRRSRAGGTARGRSGPGRPRRCRVPRCGPRRCSRRRSTSATSRRAPAARTPTPAPSTPPCGTSRPPSASSTAAAACPSPPAWRRSPPPSCRSSASGDRVVLPSDGYYTTRLLAADELERFGVRVDYVPTLEIEAAAARGTSTTPGSCCWRPPATPSSTSATSPRWPRGDPGGRRPPRRRQHDGHAARAAAAGAGRRPHRRQRHEGAHRAQRPAARPRQHDRRRAVRPDRGLARPHRQHCPGRSRRGSGTAR